MNHVIPLTRSTQSGHDMNPMPYPLNCSTQSEDDVNHVIRFAGFVAVGA